MNNRIFLLSGRSTVNASPGLSLCTRIIAITRADNDRMTSISNTTHRGKYFRETKLSKKSEF
jgi:hypothetical protein